MNRVLKVNRLRQVSRTIRKNRDTCQKLLFGVSMLICIGASFRTGLATAEPSPPDAPQCPSLYSIRINLDQPVLRLYKNGRLVHRYPVALGKPGTETPIGNWHIVDKQKNWGKGFGTRWLGFDVPWGTYGIHGTNRPESIGHYFSHGCVRMRNEDVEQLYELVPQGTPVTITGNPLAHFRTLEYGDIGADVRVVQRSLEAKGFYRGQCDGKFGPGTARAVAYLELSKRLQIDGVIGMDDYEALGLRQSKPSVP